MTNYELVKTAIAEKKIVRATYQGYEREMCPHVIGQKQGRDQALFYQFGGQSSSGLGPPGALGNWRCIPIAGLVDVQIAEGGWHTASNHSRPQTCIDDIDLEVEY